MTDKEQNAMDWLHRQFRIDGIDIDKVPPMTIWCQNLSFENLRDGETLLTCRDLGYMEQVGEHICYTEKALELYRFLVKL